MASDATGGLVNANIDTISVGSFTLGETRAYWGFNNIAASTLISDSVWTHVIVVGKINNKGFYSTINVT